MVATCDLDDQMWFYSSRGPGQYITNNDANPKPDVTAPTPKDGKVVYDNSTRILPNGWGTSGACPQVAGLAALLLSKDPQLTRNALFAAIWRGASHIGYAYNCQGHGRINCLNSFELV